jgi:hypothetical protein
VFPDLGYEASQSSIDENPDDPAGTLSIAAG